MVKKDEVLKHKELGKVVVKQDNRDDGQKLKDFIKENISSMLGSDGEPDLGKIRDILGLSSLNGYELKFPGKGIANALYSAPIYKELKNIDENKSNKINENFIIKGDNLDALKILAKGYTNKIKMIYIDPPYNTMNNDFIYNDNFRADFDAVARISGLIDESGNKSKNLEEMERIFKGTRTHSAWLCFMYPRLKLARDLLKDDGVIFISIDDNEQANLKLLCDEIFGEENFVACLPRVTKKAGKSTDKIALNHDYLLCYGSCNLSQIEVDESDYKERDEFFDERGGYKLNQTLDYNSLQYSKTMDYEIKIDNKTFYAGSDKELFLQRAIGNHNKIDWVWRWSKDKFDFGLKNGFVEIRNNRIYTKTYYKCKISDKKPYKIEYSDRTKNVSSLEFIDNKYSNDNANKNLQSILGQKNIFDYSKSVEMVKFLISQTCSDTKNDIILDFFAGSGTTAHAVMAQNLADNGNRKFILVQLDESIDEKKSKTAFEFCKNELKSEIPNISDITIERVKRAKKALNSQMEFSVYEMTDEPDIDVEENLFGARQIINPLDLVTNMLLKSGNEISGKNIECVIENRLYKVGNDYFVLDLLQKDDKELFKVLDKDRNGNVYADIYINCDIEVWLNFYAKFKERLRIL
ncbi:site-specific DNA-methyltransferase [Campylobacter sp. 34484-21]|uniref:site-specific DNA-methyltransferase (adenine-specific) n=1 Tax=Campylobacter magnus TaxID=3026462 RepID=A0ABT8TAU4_9BACT|nr:site-specific DNA-methyltransferase [Campylobacter magnus]MDO2410093.1 site-specific DNA-methyltransferase [Campylobacter magnus]